MHGLKSVAWDYIISPLYPSKYYYEIIIVLKLQIKAGKEVSTF